MHLTPIEAIEELLAGIPLVCPACRDLPRGALRLFPEEEEGGTPSKEAGAALRCPDPSCGARYPFVDRVPLLHAELDSFRVQEAPALAGELDLGEGRGHEYLSAFSWAAWADRIEPEPTARTMHGLALDYRGEVDHYLGKIVAAARELGQGILLDAGAGLGRETRSLATSGIPTLGIDLRFEALREAARLERSGEGRWLEKLPCRGYRWRELRPPPGPGRAFFALADLLDRPPLPPGSVAGAVALNLLDGVRDPCRLIKVLSELLHPGALLLMSTPFAWSEALTRAGAWPFERSDDETILLDLLLDACLVLQEPPFTLHWVLRRHAREFRVFACHTLLLRRA